MIISLYFCFEWNNMITLLYIQDTLILKLNKSKEEK